MTGLSCLTCSATSPGHSLLPPPPSEPDLPYTLWMTRTNPAGLQLPDAARHDGWYWLTKPQRFGPFCTEECAALAGGLGYELVDRLANCRRFGLYAPDHSGRVTRYRWHFDELPLAPQYQIAKAIEDNHYLPMLPGVALTADARWQMNYESFAAVAS